MGAEVPRRRHEFAARLQAAEFRIGDRAAMAIGVTEVLAGAGYAIELVGWNVVTEHVAAIVGEPELLRLRVPVEADRIAHASRHDFPATTIGIDARDDRVLLGIGLADVARRADRHVQLAVRTEGDEFAAMMTVVGEGIADDDRSGRGIEPLRYRRNGECG